MFNELEDTPFVSIEMPAILLFTAAMAGQCTPDRGGSSDVDVVLPTGAHVKMHCAPMINYNGLSAKFGGLEIPITKVGSDIKVGTVNLDETTLRQASDLIEALDTAQYTYCRTLPFVAPNDVYKMWQDNNTQQIALTNLLRNLSGAQNPTEARAAIVTAAKLASTATAAASSPPLLTSPSAPVPAATAPAAPPAPAAPIAPTAPTAPSAAISSGPAPTPAPPAPATVAIGASKAAAALQSVANQAKTNP